MAPSVVFNDGNIAVDSNTPAKPTSAARQSSVLHRSIHKQPKKVVHASGNYVTFEDGQELLDATGGAAVACIGHSDPRVRDAMIAQMNRVSYCNSMFFSSASGEDIAEILVDSTGGKMSKALILSSGSEAMEAALKMARQYFQELDPPQPQRYHFIARRESYHGNTLGACMNLLSDYKMFSGLTVLFSSGRQRSCRPAGPLHPHSLWQLLPRLGLQCL